MLNVNLDALSTVVHLIPEQAEVSELSSTIQETFDRAVEGTGLTYDDRHNLNEIRCVANKDFSLFITKALDWDRYRTHLAFYTPEFSVEVFSAPGKEILNVLWNGNELRHTSYAETQYPEALSSFVKNSEHKVIAKTILEAAKDTVLGRPYTNKNLGLSSPTRKGTAMKLNGVTLNSLQRAITEFTASGYHQPTGVDSASGFNDKIQNNMDKVASLWRTETDLGVSTHRSLKQLSITGTEISGKTYEFHVSHHWLPSTGERFMGTTLSISSKGRAVWLSLHQPFGNGEQGNLNFYLSIGTLTVPLHDLDSSDDIPDIIKQYTEDVEFITKDDIVSMLKVIKAYLNANAVTVGW